MDLLIDIGNKIPLMLQHHQNLPDIMQVILVFLISTKIPVKGIGGGVGEDRILIEEKKIRQIF